MTLRLFFHSDDLKANVEVLDCTPHENEFAVVLRATLFHPQGGGQSQYFPIGKGVGHALAATHHAQTALERWR